jgi:hypothetical protein
MSDRFAFLFFAVGLLPFGLYAVLNPRGVNREKADGPYFKSALANIRLCAFRAAGIVTLGRSAFFAYRFWTH